MCLLFCISCIDGITFALAGILIELEEGVLLFLDDYIYCL